MIKVIILLVGLGFSAFMFEILSQICYKMGASNFKEDWGGFKKLKETIFMAYTPFVIAWVLGMIYAAWLVFWLAYELVSSMRMSLLPTYLASIV